MTIFGKNYAFVQKNNTWVLHEYPPTEPALNYVFFGSFTLNFVITGIVNPAVLWLRLKTASNSIPSFITCFLMVSDLVTNIYFPILWNYKLLRKDPNDDQLYLLNSPFEVFNTCLLETVSLLSVFYVAALSFLMRRNVKDPLNPVSVGKAKRVIIGGTVLISVAIITILSVMMVMGSEYVFFSKYAQKVIDYFFPPSMTSISFQCFWFLRLANILIICVCYFEIAYRLIRKSGMGETRRQRIKGGKVVAAMSLGAIVGSIFNPIFDWLKNDIANNGILLAYFAFLMSCFLPSMLATYNSFIQVALVKEVRDVFTRKNRINISQQSVGNSRLPRQTENTCMSQ